ncbi:hypothetical protein CASFOL_029804 [Castilleja foliolosa]|uniref:Phytocyanin domain-containing protein n=1 Tax=Castilleja foliolosa TaxID=1961234 RepID=A0ABD3C8V5_9LAMI
MALLIIEKRGVVVCLCLVFVLFQVSINGEVYKVGDDAGWTRTIIGNVNYTDWANNKTFQLGDVIVFEYNPEFHNVVQVTPGEYRSCEVSSPIATYTSGNDSIAIKTEGHHFYVCGVPDHCEAGQKVDINVLAAPSPVAISPPGATAPPSKVPARPRNDARPNNYMQLGWVVVQLLMLAGVLFRI